MSFYALHQLLLQVFTDSNANEAVSPPLDLRLSQEPTYYRALDQDIVFDGEDVRLDLWGDGQPTEVTFVALAFDASVSLFFGQTGFGGAESPGVNNRGITTGSPGADGWVLAINNQSWTRDSSRGLWVRPTANTRVRGYMLLE